jgi:simple sugar transport system ATP-binding protein
MRKIEKLEMSAITKTFHGVPANDDISLTIRAGEILGLLGENGAGKTTLMNILYGLYQPDRGEIRINDQTVRIKSPLDSIRQGIGMVHQHFMLIQNHSVVENVALGYKKTPLLFPRKKLVPLIREFSSRFNFAIDPHKKIWELSAGEQQRVEIAKVLLNGADLLILDEPTSVLTPRESADLFEMLALMKSQGHSVILISHKLDEILAHCDRVTVLRKGRIVGRADTAEVDKKDLARMMIGREVIFNVDREVTSRKAAGQRERILRVEGLSILSDKGLPAVKGIGFDIYRHEIFGIAGVSGNGQRELVEGITGLRKVETGRITIDTKEITNQSARCIYDRGVSHVPEERIKFGIAPGLCLYDNAILKQQHLGKYSRLSFLAYRRIKHHARQLIQDFKVLAPSIHVQTKNLSGGNIQKLILGREISERPSLLVASHPTYGLDVGATEYLRQQLLQRRREGGAVLLVSEDLEEIFELCDRVAVMYQGEFMGILSPEDPRTKDIGLMMAGSLRIDGEGRADGAG